jgi:UDPglucose 6-dehydrogenase
LALFCEKKGVDYLEACRLMDYSHVLRPTLPKLGHDEFQTETSLLLDEATSLNIRLRIPAAASEINEEMVGRVAGLARAALRDCGKTIRRARVTLLGISRTPNMNDAPNETVIELAEMLEARGAKVSLYDPHFSGEESSEAPNRFKKNLNEALEGADCIVILAGHDQFRHLDLKKLKAVMKAPAAIIDCEGILEPDKIEKGGFTYRGLGRGVWKK